jgi:hypothetical protein
MKAGLPLLALTLAVAACAPSAKAPPVATAATPAPRPPVASAPVRPAPLPAPADTNWTDAPLTQGSWLYEGSFTNSLALFGDSSEAAFALWCDKDTRVVGIDRTVRSAVGQQPTMIIRTETASRQFPLVSVRDGSLTAQFSANDPLLDAMALSKGRFAVEVEGMPPLYLPSHAEVSRVIEDCR